MVEKSRIIGRSPPGDAGIIHEDRDVPEDRGGMCSRSEARLTVGDIEANAGGPPPCSHDGICHRRGARGIQVGNDDACAARGQAVGNCRPVPLGRTCHNGHVPVEKSGNYPIHDAPSLSKRHCVLTVVRYSYFLRRKLYNL